MSSRKRRQSQRPHAVVAGTSRPGTWTWLLVAAVFVVGLVVRVQAFQVPRQVAPNRMVQVDRWQPSASIQFLENDEKIYLALVEQLDAGRGYTLRGHPLLNNPSFNREQYGQALFFHPPGGIGLFWGFHLLVGDAGPALAQVFCFVVFFWSVMLLGETMIAPSDGATRVLLAVSAAFTPIMAHVTGRLWLDGPLLAFSTAAWAAFVRGQVPRRTWVIWAAGALLGYASLIKLTAFLVVPGVIATGWCLTPPEHRRQLILSSLLFVGIALLVQLPWTIWQWWVLGTPFPTWAGRPAAALVQLNGYVRYLTVIRRPWIYLELLPQVIWTTVPSLVLLGLQWRNRVVRARGIALVAAIAVVVGANIALGAIGYSKVLRYAILVTPATSVLFALVAGAALRAWRDVRGVWGGRPMVVAMVGCALLGLGVEVVQSLQTTFVDNAKSDLIRPLTGLGDQS